MSLPSDHVNHDLCTTSPSIEAIPSRQGRAHQVQPRIDILTYSRWITRRRR